MCKTSTWFDVIISRRHTFALNEKAELLQRIQGLEKQLLWAQVEVVGCALNRSRLWAEAGSQRSRSGVEPGSPGTGWSRLIPAVADSCGHFDMR